MKIFHLCCDPGIPVDGTKGASVHLRSLADAFARHSELTLITSRPPAPSGRPYPVVASGGPIAVEALVGRFGVPDVIYERYSLGCRVGLDAARRLGRPFVLEVNAPLVDEARRHRPESLGPQDAGVEVELLREADLVIAVSSPLRDFVARVRGDRPTVVMPNGFDPDLLPEHRRELPLPTVGFLGHPKPWHGVAGLAAVVRDLRGSGSDVRLLVVGGGPGADEVRAAATREGVGEFVEVTGPLPHREALRRISGAWVGVAPYPATEFFYFSPIKVIEYLAVGLPVVATDQGDVSALVADGGVTVPPGDHAAMVEAIGDLVSDTERRCRLSAAGRERVVRDRTWDSVARTSLDAMRKHCRGLSV